jgi:hypothetical protein
MGCPVPWNADDARKIRVVLLCKYGLRMHIMGIFAFASSLAVVAFAQAQEGQANPVDGLVLPLPDAPLSVEAVGITENVLADGALNTRTSRAKVYRDSDGRTRTDSTLQFAPLPEEPSPIIQIMDPVAGVQFLLIVQEQIAYRIVIPKAERIGRPQFGFIVGSELIRETGEKTHKSGVLGVRTIEGVEFAGTRTTTTMVDQPSKIAVDEHWISRDLGLIGAILQSSPNGKTTVEIHNLVHSEPAPSLFAVPPEYTIKDIPIYPHMHQPERQSGRFR